MFRLAILTTGAVLAAVITVGADDPPAEAPPRYSNATVLNQMWSHDQQGAPGRVRFHQAPMHLADIGTIAPLGMMVRDHVTPSDHMGFGPRDFTAPLDRWEVFAPADGFIVTLTRKIVVSLGDFNSQQNQYWVVGNAPDPSTVTEANRVVKYELVYAGLSNGGDPFDASQFGVQGVVLAELLPAPPPPASADAGVVMTAAPSRRARIEVFPGKRASDVTGFTSAARIYER